MLGTLGGACILPTLQHHPRPSLPLAVHRPSSVYDRDSKLILLHLWHCMTLTVYDMHRWTNDASMYPNIGTSKLMSRALLDHCGNWAILIRWQVPNGKGILWRTASWFLNIGPLFVEWVRSRVSDIRRVTLTWQQRATRYRYADRFRLTQSPLLVWYGCCCYIIIVISDYGGSCTSRARSFVWLFVNTCENLRVWEYLCGY